MKQQQRAFLKDNNTQKLCVFRNILSNIWEGRARWKSSILISSTWVHVSERREKRERKCRSMLISSTLRNNPWLLRFNTFKGLHCSAMVEQLASNSRQYRKHRYFTFNVRSLARHVKHTEFPSTDTDTGARRIERWYNYIFIKPTRITRLYIIVAQKSWRDLGDRGIIKRENHGLAESFTVGHSFEISRYE